MTLIHVQYSRLDYEHYTQTTVTSDATFGYYGEILFIIISCCFHFWSIEHP
jgi:hypothetical protein